MGIYLVPRFQCGKQLCSPPPTGGPRCCSQSGLTSLQAHRTALLKQLVTGEATQDMS